MMHRKRRFCVSEAESAEELAHKLTSTTWTLCTGFRVAGHPDYLFLNDSTSEDGAGEYAVCRQLGPDTFVQIESITFSWCDEARALEYIRRTLAGQFDAGASAQTVDLRHRLDRSEAHGRCPLCA